MTNLSFIEWKLITSEDVPLGAGIVLFNNCYVYAVDKVIESNNNIVICFDDDTDHIIQPDEKIYYIDEDILITLPKIE